MSFLLAHWRTVAVLAALLAAFVGGRYTVRTQTVTVTRTEYKDRIVEKVVQAEVKTQIVYRDRIRKPDGTVETHEKIESGSRTTTTDDKRTTEEGKTATVVIPPPLWHVHVDFGAPLALPLDPYFTVGVERQIVGPFSVGIWGSADIHGQHPAGGVSLGVSF
jgi:hypothetical protein